jgi:chorismate dehydratase
MIRQGAEPLEIFDLVERWQVLTGLPFIFAFWAVRSGFSDRTVVDALNKSRDFGVANIKAISEIYSKQLDMKEESIRQYLETNIHYSMDHASVEGLELFYEKAAHAGAISSVRRLEFL